MSREATFHLNSAFETLLLKVVEVSVPPTAEQREGGRRALRELRLGLGAQDPVVLETARRILEALDGTTSVGPAGRSARVPFAEEALATQLTRRFEEELERGRIAVERRQVASLTERRPQVPELPPLPPPRREVPGQTFEVRFVDEINQAISGVEAEFEADGAQTRVTNAAGVALLEGVQATRATVSVTDHEALAKILEPRWEKFRRGSPPKEANITTVDFRGSEVGPVPLKGGVSNTVVIKPPVGKLFVELWDKSGRARHAKQAIVIDGPQQFQVESDDNGRLLIENVLPGDYSLSFALEHDEPQPLIDVIESPLIVLDMSAQEPQMRFVGAVRRLVLARLKRMFFETNKSFLLPGSAGAFRQIRDLYRANNPSELLIVGHTDTTAEPTINDPLSVERADMTAAYLLDDVDAWLGQYEERVPVGRRWSAHEDELMLSAMPDFGTKPENEADVRWFQRTRGLTVDGKAGPKTRRQLITEYLALDGTSLKDRRSFDIRITTHGCGENFPLDDGGEGLDQPAADEKEDASDRRVELFFFDAELGILPPPPGKTSTAGSTEYPEWRKRATRVVDLESSFIEGLIVEWSIDLDTFVPDDLVLEAKQGEKSQRMAWTDGIVDGDLRRFIYRKILGPTPVTLTALSETAKLELVLWREQVVLDAATPPQWENLLEDSFALLDKEPDDSVEPGEEVIAVSDVAALALPEQFV